MAIFYETKQESILGSALSGSDGDANRTYSLVNTIAVAPGMQVSVDGVWLQYGYHYTLSNNIITFLVPTYNTSAIVIDYQIISSTLTSGTYYTTPALVQAELRTSTAFSSITIPSIDAVNNWIEEESRYIDTLTNSVYSSNTASSILVDYDGEGRLRFPHAPLISITKIEYREIDNTFTTLVEGFDEDFLSYLDLGEVEFISNYSPGNKKFRLTYNYGTTTVPLDIQKLATLLVTKRTLLTLANSQANTEGGSIQIGTIQITDPTSYNVNYINNLSNEIKDYVANIGRGFKVYRPTRVYL
jgi:hypothetical protein